MSTHCYLKAMFSIEQQESGSRHNGGKQSAGREQSASREQSARAKQSWGGQRVGAGRKAESPSGRRRVPHSRREWHAAANPVHVTLRAGVRCLRTQRVFPVIRAALRAVNRQRGETFRVVEFSVQANHIHLIIEARDNDALSRGVQALSVRIAKGTNSVLRRRGSLFVDRFHARDLSSPSAVRNAIVYVLGNFRKHCTWEAQRGFSIDPYSSAPYFSDYRSPVSTARNLLDRESPVRPARTWLLVAGWKKYGLISTDEAPRSAA